MSIVVTARNDGYGGDFLHRMQAFLNVLTDLCSKQERCWELIIVEWNPPADRASLADALDWPRDVDPDAIRVFRVPSGIHNRFPNSDKMPLFEYIAKNVGIRRARGRFVLVTNPDIIFSEEIIKYLFTGRLREGRFYRVNRFNVDEEIPLCASVEGQLVLCEKNSKTVHTRFGQVSADQSMRERIALELRSRKRRISTRDNDEFTYLRDVRRLHLDAPGDFFLMAKAKWDDLRGYPEFASHAHVDAYICVMAASLGLRQVILSDTKKIFHQEHDRSAHATRPSTDLELFRMRGVAMLLSESPAIFNDEDWGLAAEPLETFSIGSGHSREGRAGLGRVDARY